MKQTDVLLPNGTIVQALIPVNDRKAKTYIGNVDIQKRAAMTKIAKGDNGSCVEYAKNIQKQLESLGITDEHVVDFVSKL